MKQPNSIEKQPYGNTYELAFFEPQGLSTEKQSPVLTDDVNFIVLPFVRLDQNDDSNCACT